MSSEEMRESRLLEVAEKTLYESQIEEIAKHLPKPREIDLDKIFTERIRVFRELSNR